ncbi:MAG TPA: 30S ribosomal protein S4, partial [Candidatus Aenigmarchaeota archaeon]|nr:30S ribosomal protein S4 [Candidatus Aenigmarchaeota archaeon]
PWYSPRIAEEKKLLKKYGLRRKREIWSAQEVLRKFRRRARAIIAVENREEEKTLLDKLSRLGMLPGDASLDDILALSVNDVLERRLQTLVFKKGMAESIRHARQLIVHGHVMVNGRRIKFPSYLVPVNEEKTITLIEKHAKSDKK